MNVDLLGTIRLLHRVFGFLAQQSNAQLTDLATGRATLTTNPTVPALPPPAGATGPAVPAPPAAVPAVPEQASVLPGPRVSTRRSPAPPTADYATIATALRDQQSVHDGLAYLDSLRLHGKKPTKQDLIAIAAEMGLTLAPATRNPDMIRKLIDHAVGARRKYAGLSSW